MKTTIFAVLMSLVAAVPQSQPPQFPREGAKRLIDNERVSVWDVTVEKGQKIPGYRTVLDTVTVDLKGSASFARSATVQEPSVATDASHTIVIELKQGKFPPVVNKSGLPEAFPRQGAKHLVDNTRVNVWDFSWALGKPSEMHYHSTDVVVVYLDNGELESTTPDGKKTVNASSFGQVKFNARDRAHSETLVKGKQRVIAVELK